MQENLQDFVDNLLSDDSTKQAVNSLISTLSETPQGQNENNTMKQSVLEKNISLINTLLPFLPQKNVKKAYLLIKILEIVKLMDEIKAQTSN